MITIIAKVFMNMITMQEVYLPLPLMNSNSPYIEPDRSKYMYSFELLHLFNQIPFFEKDDNQLLFVSKLLCFFSYCSLHKENCNFLNDNPQVSLSRLGFSLFMNASITAVHISESFTLSENNLTCNMYLVIHVQDSSDNI